MLLAIQLLLLLIPYLPVDFLLLLTISYFVGMVVQLVLMILLLLLPIATAAAVVTPAGRLSW